MNTCCPTLYRPSTFGRDLLTAVLICLSVSNFPSSKMHMQSITNPQMQIVLIEPGNGVTRVSFARIGSVPGRCTWEMVRGNVFPPKHMRVKLISRKLLDTGLWTDQNSSSSTFDLMLMPSLSVNTAQTETTLSLHNDNS